MACGRITMPGGGKMWVCGDLNSHNEKINAFCGDCGDYGAGFLCDFPVGEGKTCDRSLCEDCAVEVAPDIHYCSVHYQEWQKFCDRNGVENALKNVVPFSCKAKGGE